MHPCLFIYQINTASFAIHLTFNAFIKWHNGSNFFHSGMNIHSKYVGVIFHSIHECTIYFAFSYNSIVYTAFHIKTFCKCAHQQSSIAQRVFTERQHLQNISGKHNTVTYWDANTESEHYLRSLKYWKTAWVKESASNLPTRNLFKFMHKVLFVKFSLKKCIKPNG